MEHNLEHIEQYLTGDLSKEEKAAFENQMKVDQQLAEEVELIRNMTGGIRLYGHKKLKSELDIIHKKVITPKEKGRFRLLNSKWIFGVAASLAVLLVAYVAWQSKISPTAEQLYAEYHQAYDWTISKRGNTDEQLMKIHQLYQGRNYEAFLQQTEQLQLDISKDPPLALAMGQAYGAIGQTDQARNYFKMAEANALFSEEALWYQALSYLKTGSISEAVNTLEVIKEQSSTSFAKKADQLLRELGKIKH
ncbi:MAG: hypothetical protein DHS20C18_42880 [Saprospiraceae bacterium]|nr:MAG: hypothetical protein DHS20C18_42880 [Saprospiraceae bacterium]